MFDCACGGKTDHIGACHFGWHNPKTCPTENYNKITTEEKKEVKDMIRDTMINDIRVFTGADKRSAAFTADSIIKYLESIGYRADV